MTSQNVPVTAETSWDSECIAALLWDVPQLSRGSTGAQAFRDALGPPPWRFEIDESNPLAVAARALVAEQEGDVEEALASYLMLGRSEGYWPALLGWCLAAFSSSPDAADSLGEAFRRVRQLAPSQLQARLLAKVAAFALDRNDQRTFIHALEGAIEASDEESHLRQTLQLLAFNVGLFEIDLPAVARLVVERDPLVDLDWIDSVALRAARGDLVDELKARARGPWSWQIRSGRTPTDEIISAEAQATWAGALWLRPELRRQLGAQVLRGLARDEATLLYALTMWITGGGDNIHQVIELVEPQFSGTTADELVEPLINAVALPGMGDLRLAETAVATWDLLTDDLFRVLLERLPAVGGTAPDAEAIRRFWAYGSMRVPDDVNTRLAGLAPTVQAEVVALMPMTGLEHVSKQVAEQVLAAVSDAEHVRGDLAGAALFLARRFNLPLPTYQLPPAELVEFIQRVPEAMSPEEARRAESALRESLASEADAARGGSASFGGTSKPLALARISATAGIVDPQTVALLLETAADTATPAHLRLDCIVALGQLERADLLPGTAEDAIARIPDVGTPSFFREVPGQLIRAARLVARARRLSEEERVAVLVLARDRDPAARQFAVGAAGIASRAESSPPLEAAVIAGLYDPAPSVVTEALVALREATFSMPGALASVIERLPRLFDESGRGVRSEVAVAARALYAREVLPDLSALAALVGRAGADRSWRVRRAASDADVGSP
jgi:hypothetical protein